MSEIIRTKEMIAEKMSALVEKRSIDKITVKDLVEECGISRQTFYYHFHDLMDVVEWTMEQRVEAKISECMAIGDPEEALYRMISYSPGEREIIANLLRSQHRDHIERAIIRNLRNYLETMLKSKSVDLRMSPSDMNVLLDFWAFGIVGVLLNSISRGDLDERRLAKQICNLVTGKYLKDVTGPASA